MAQDPINLGTTADDRTGDDWRSGGEKINADIAALYGNPLTNVINIDSPDDFPAASGGVRELVPSSGATITYVIAATAMDMGSDRFTVTDGTVVFRGMHRTGSQVTSAATGDFITVNGGSFVTEFMLLSCPNAQVISFTGDGALDFLVFQNTVILSATRWGTIAGAVTTSMRILNAIGSSVAGFLWTGTLNGEINVTDTRLSGWTGTALDLGTATFNLIDITSDTRLISPSGTTTLSGLSGDANIKTGGRAIVDGVFFNGSGTSVVGIDTHDLKWQFSGCTFATDEITHNSENRCDAFLTVPVTVTINAIGIYEEVNGTDFSFSQDDRFTVSTSGVSVSDGLDNLELMLSAKATLEKTGGGSDELEIRMAKNWQPTDTTKTGDTNTDINITNMSSIANLKAGVFVSGTDIPADTTIVSVGATDSIVISNAATGSTATVPLTFHDKGIPFRGTTTQNATPTGVVFGASSSAVTDDDYRMILANNTSTANIEVSLASYEINSSAGTS